MTVRQIAAAELGRDAQSVGDMAMMWSNRQGQDLLGYNVLGVEPVKVRGQDAVAVDYAYVIQPPGPASPLSFGLRTSCCSGDTVTIVSFAATADEYEAQADTWRRILASLDVQ